MQKSDHPRVPISVSEIVQDAIECRDAGAAMIHVHARDHRGNHSLSIDDNQLLLESLESELGDTVLLQLTTEAIGIYTPEQQRGLIKAVCPKAASFALRELLPMDTREPVNPQSVSFFDWVASQNMLAQYILYDRADVERYLKLCKLGIIPESGRHVLLVLGRHSQNLTAYPHELLPFIADSDIVSQRWGVCAFGPYEHQCLATAMLLGADIRVGFENNLLDVNGEAAHSNASQVSTQRQLASTLNVPVLSPNAYREELLG
jgi:uncharacterized protein (DUF849 family)